MPMASALSRITLIPYNAASLHGSRASMGLRSISERSSLARRLQVGLSKLRRPGLRYGERARPQQLTADRIRSYRGATLPSLVAKCLGFGSTGLVVRAPRREGDVVSEPPAGPGDREAAMGTRKMALFIEADSR